MKIMWTVTPAASGGDRPPRYLLTCRDCERRESYAHAQPLQGLAQAHADATGHTVDVGDTWTT